MERTVCNIPKLRLYATFVVGFCVVMIVLQRLMPSFPNQWIYFAQPITNQLSEVNTSFPSRLTNPMCPLSGYILVLKYAGQQGVGVKSLVSLQRWVKGTSLPMMIVEPFIQDSVLGTYRKSFQELKFSDMFDLENFNHVSQSEGVPGLIPWETYVNCAPARAVLVRLQRTASPALPKVMWDARRDSGDCWKNSDKFYTITMNKTSVCYVRLVKYFHTTNSSHVISAGEVYNIFLAGLEVTTVNLVFDYWSAVWHVASAPPRSGSPFFSDHLSVSYKKNGSVFLTHKLQDSPKILWDVKNYQRQFLMRFAGPSYVAVMLRTEYTLIWQRRAKKHAINFTELQKLLDETVNVTTMVKTELGIKDVFVTADVGQYGSTTWKGTVHSRFFSNGQWDRGKEQVKHTVERLYMNKWTFEKWENSFAQATGGVKDRGYIAAVQRGIASRASCLIMLGGGSFQELTLKNYVGHTEQHKRCIHFVGTKYTSNVKKLYALKNT